MVATALLCFGTAAQDRIRLMTGSPQNLSAVVGHADGLRHASTAW
jgi:hypothetical protein